MSIDILRLSLQYGIYLNMRTFIFLGLILCFSSCKDPVHITSYPNGSLKEKFSYRKNMENKWGEYRKYDEEGKLFEVSTYENGQLMGLRKIYSVSGQLLTIENYKNGVIDSLFKDFYPNGKSKREGYFLQGKMNGIWKTYYENGQTKEIVSFRDNEENGPFIEYFQNGHLKAKGNYLNGDSEDGILHIYKEDGTLERIMKCQQGICRTVSKFTNE